MSVRALEAFPILGVADVPRSLRFYRDLLGGRLAYAFPSEDDPAYASLELAGGSLGLARAEGPVESGSAVIWVYVEDVDVAVGELRAAGAPVVAEPADQPWGERVASVADPDGYTVHLGARPGTDGSA